MPPRLLVLLATAVIALAVDVGCGPSVADDPKTAQQPNPPDDDDGGVVEGDAGAPRDGAPKPDGQASVHETPTIVPGAHDRFLLTGVVVAPNDTFEGQVLVEGNVITCVAPGTACASRTGAQGATSIDTKGVIAPGLIDTHNHILFDVFDDDDWKPAQVYTNHESWTKEPRYAAMLDTKQCLANDSQGKPAWCTQTPYGTAAGSLRCEMAKFGELKGLIAGTTSIVGLPGTSSGCFASVARSIDVPQNGLGIDKIQTSATFPPTKSSADGVCSNFAAATTSAYLVHCGEGTDGDALDELARLRTITTDAGCLFAPQTTITHGTAFGATEFAAMAAAGMKLTWSPRSNVSLYDATTDIPAALDAGVVVSLGPDWSMGGSQNMLDEMRFARDWSDAHWNGRLTSEDLVRFATGNAAKAVGLASTMGQLAEGFVADVAVFAGDRTKPYDAIVGARPRDVMFVMIGGTPLYGAKALEAAAPSPPTCETLDVCGETKFLCVATASGTNKLDQTYATIERALQEALVAVDTVTAGDGFDFAPLTPLVKCQ